MYKANHEALVQATNIGLINIRQSEVNYYLGVNATFGTQAALIGGFTYSIFTQNQANLKNSYSIHFLTAYFIVTALTISTSLHVIIATTMVQVLGPGLALNGPVGSMTRAIVGMQIEQRQIVRSFFIMIISFAISTLFAFWVVTDITASVGSTIIIIIAACTWFTFGKRVFLRFYYKGRTKPLGNWGGDDSFEQSGEEDDDEPTIHGKVQLKNVSPYSDKKVNFDLETNSTKSVTSEKSNTTKTNKSKSVARNFFNTIESWLQPTDKEIRDSILEAEMYATQEIKQNSNGIVMEGYLTKRGLSKIEFIKEPWSRRYFVLNYQGELACYRNRQDFRDDPNILYKDKRPIDLDEYQVVPSGVTGMHMDETSSVTTSNTTKNLPAFQISLKPKWDESNRQWHLRCDTEEILNNWLIAMRQVSPNSFTAEGTQTLNGTAGAGSVENV